MGLEDYGPYTKLVRKIEGRDKGTRVELEQLRELLRHVEEPVSALHVLSLLSRCVLKLPSPTGSSALRAELLALAWRVGDPAVGDGVLWAIWRQRWRGKASLTSAEFHFWLCDQEWEAGEWAHAHWLVGERLERLMADEGMLPLLVDMYPTSQRALLSLAAASPIPSQHAVGVFMRHLREGDISLDVARWAWRGVVSEEREQVLLMMCEQKMSSEPGPALLRMLWSECERAQERLLLLRLRDVSPRMGAWRELSREALSSEYAPLHAEAVSTLRQYGGPPDVAALLEAAQGRSEEQHKAIQDAIRVIQRGADQLRFAGALSLQEDGAGGEGALSLAGGEAGGLSEAGAGDAPLAPVVAGEVALSGATRWREAAPAPRALSSGARLVLLAQGSNPRLSAALFAVGVLPPLGLIVASALGVESSALWGLHTGLQIYIMPFFFLMRTGLWSAFRRGAVVEGELRPGTFEARSGKEYKLKGSLARREEPSGVALVSQDRAYDLDLFKGLSITSEGGIVASKRAVALSLLVLGLTNNVLVGFVLGMLFCIPSIIFKL